jgi:anti-anti-sigma factor
MRDAGEGAARWLRIDEQPPECLSTWNVREPPDSWSMWRVCGEIDYGTADSFGRHLRMAAQRPGPIVLDMSEVSFMDTSGIRELIRVRNAGHEVIIRRPSYSVEFILGLTHLDQVMRVDEAVRRAV